MDKDTLILFAVVAYVLWTRSQAAQDIHRVALLQQQTGNAQQLIASGTRVAAQVVGAIGGLVNDYEAAEDQAAWDEGYAGSAARDAAARGQID